MTLASHVCDKCGQAIPMIGGVRLDGLTILAEGRGDVKLTKLEALFFSYLLINPHQTKSRDNIMNYIICTDGRDEDRTDTVVSVLVCHVRKKIARLGLEIETVWGLGYRLRVKPANAEATS